MFPDIDTMWHRIESVWPRWSPELTLKYTYNNNSQSDSLTLDMSWDSTTIIMLVNGTHDKRVYSWSCNLLCREPCIQIWLNVERQGPKLFRHWRMTRWGGHYSVGQWKRPPISTPCYAPVDMAFVLHTNQCQKSPGLLLLCLNPGV